ncbi:MAG: SMP-30/gluconolactonase/LRE family protein [Longimicrobiales bacterium]|nr:SMP-30/gluconolactonase/LRE family protein [Longimicrobiales bacterium]
MRATLRILFAALLLTGGVFGFEMLRDAGLFRSVEGVRPGPCRVVSGVPGPEDIVWDPDSGYAWISSLDRRGAFEGHPTPGAIFRYRPGHPDSLVNLTPDAGIEFRPHGISLVTGPDGAKRLFVVSHPGGGRFDRPKPWPAERPRHTIEIFDLVDGELVHVRTHADAALVNPNDVAGVDFERFYVTNDHGAASRAARRIEDWLRRPWANVVYFDGTRFSVAADRLTNPNGIAVSPDRGTVYVAETAPNRLRILDRDPTGGGLTERGRRELDFGADNVEVDPLTGEVWLAGHPRLLSVLPHARDATRPSPSIAVRIAPGGNDEGRTVFSDAGELLSTASVAVPAGRHLLIGAFMSPHFVECELTAPEGSIPDR